MVKGSFIVLPVELVFPDIVPLTTVDVHEKIVPVTLAIRSILVVLPEQMVFVFGVVVITGLGLMVTSMVPFGPEHPLTVPEKVYLTTAGIMPVLVIFCFIREPVPAENPTAIPVCREAVQLISVPDIVEVRPMFVESREQIVWLLRGMGVIIGKGLTMISDVKVSPLHSPTDEIVVYVTVPLIL